MHCWLTVSFSPIRTPRNSTKSNPKASPSGKRGQGRRKAQAYESCRGGFFVTDRVFWNSCLPHSSLLDSSWLIQSVQVKAGEREQHDLQQKWVQGCGEPLRAGAEVLAVVAARPTPLGCSSLPYGSHAGRNAGTTARGQRTTRCCARRASQGCLRGFSGGKVLSWPHLLSAFATASSSSAAALPCGSPLAGEAMG